jgi:hypothetical protein
MENPKNIYHSFSKIGSIGERLGKSANAQRLDEAIGKAAPDFTLRYIAGTRQAALRNVSITTIEEAIGAARAVPEKLEKLIGSDAVNVLRSNQFLKEARESAGKQHGAMTCTPIHRKTTHEDPPPGRKRHNFVFVKVRKLRITATCNC